MQKAALASLVFSVLAIAVWIATVITERKEKDDHVTEWTATDRILFWSLPVMIVGGGVSAFIALRNK